MSNSLPVVLGICVCVALTRVWRTDWSVGLEVLVPHSCYRAALTLQAFALSSKEGEGPGTSSVAWEALFATAKAGAA